jgi:hypothetical protein
MMVIAVESDDYEAFFETLVNILKLTVIYISNFISSAAQ